MESIIRCFDVVDVNIIVKLFLDVVHGDFLSVAHVSVAKANSCLKGN